MGDVTIKNIEDLVQKAVGPEKTVGEITVKRLTAPGENYLGLVLKVEAVVKNEKGEEENFIAVAKCVNSKLPEFMRKSVPNQFKKENGFYSEIVPTLEDYQKEVGLEEKGINDVFAKLYTSRFSLNEGSQEPDEDSVLLFEYLGDKGYVNIDRTVGFDLDGAKLILKDLAAFHAISIAVKLNKPDVFKNKIQKYLYKVFQESETDKAQRPPDVMDKMKDLYFKILEPYEETKPYIEKLRARLGKDSNMMESFNMEGKEPFATISHADLWTNNTMQVLEDGKPIKNKILDFQTFHYFSATQDLIFFLWSSIQLDILKEHLDDLVKFYHNRFISILDKCGCDTTPFNYENFLKEFDETAKIEFIHVLMMQAPIYGKKGEAVFEMENMDKKDEMEKAFSKIGEKFTETTRNRMAFVVQSFGERAWI